MLRPERFFDLSDWAHVELFVDVEMIWEVLPRIKPYLTKALKPNVQDLNLDGHLLRETVVLRGGELITGKYDLVLFRPTSCCYYCPTHIGESPGNTTVRWHDIDFSLPFLPANERNLAAVR